MRTVALLAIAFLRVLSNCDGSPGTVDGYSVQVSIIDAQHTPCQVCCDDDCTALCDGSCITYLMGPWAENLNVPDPGAGDEITLAWDLPDVPPDSLAMLRIQTERNGVIYGDCP